MPILSRILLAALLLGASSEASAENDLVLGAGWFDFSSSDKDSANFSGEWRGPRLFYDLRPDIGLQVNSDGGVYGYAGFNYDWRFAPHWAAVPELDIGGWSRGDSKDLGGAFEFHEAFELDYIFDSDYRLGAQIAHTSNADIYDRNPGANTLMATFTIPLGNR